jgi:outer membrane protein OmpA-like peptidoglycan-associated protein/tetratricopeptide (TPR) repeat protein
MRLIILLLLTLNLSSLHSQNSYVTAKEVPEKVNKYFKLGMEMLYNKRADQAVRYFDKALAANPNFIDAKIFKAGALTQTGDLKGAESGFEEVIELDAEYDKEVFYDVGMVEFKMEKYEEALDHFKIYLETNPENERRKASATDFYQRSQLMVESAKNPIDFRPKNLGTNINNAGDQYLPALTADGKTLIFSMVVGEAYGHEDFYKSEKVDGEWQRSTPLTAVNTQNSEGAHAISADGSFLLFTACKRKTGFGSCDLFYSELKCGEWSEVKVMDRPVSSGSWESQPSISADGKTIYFASDREGSLGGKDLWVTHRQDDGTWSNPENLGETLNTNKDEKAPFIHPDGQTLYFLSAGHPGLGYEDIFISRKQKDGSWGIPQNFGYPINTEKSEGPIFVSLDGKTAYFSSNRTDFEEAQGKMDIYTFELPEKFRPLSVTFAKAQVKDVETGEKIEGANIEFVDLVSGKTHTLSKTDCNGEFLVTLPSGKNYLLNISKENYLFHSENFELTTEGSFDNPFHLEVGLLPIPTADAKVDSKEPKRVILKNVFFETGSAELKEASLNELNRLKKLLETNPDLKIQINGHTDNIGSEEDNLQLSDDRAKAVYDFLIKEGISSERLNYKGFGESSPINSNETASGRKNNRRTEFEVIE